VSYKLPKIPHPWWHWFFMFRTAEGMKRLFADSPEWVEIECVACQKRYILNPIDKTLPMEKVGFPAEYTFGDKQ